MDKSGCSNACASQEPKAPALLAPGPFLRSVANLEVPEPNAIGRSDGTTNDVAPTVIVPVVIAIIRVPVTAIAHAIAETSATEPAAAEATMEAAATSAVEATASATVAAASASTVATTTTTTTRRGNGRRDQAQRSDGTYGHDHLSQHLNSPHKVIRTRLAGKSKSFHQRIEYRLIARNLRVRNEFGPERLFAFLFGRARAITNSFVEPSNAGEIAG